MGGFCHYCGKELEGDEPYCPECGMPTGSPQTPQPVYYNRPKRNVGLIIAVIVVVSIALISILLIAILPSLLVSDEDTYQITVTVESFSIDIADISQYTEPTTDVHLFLSCTYGSSTANEDILLEKNHLLANGSTIAVGKQVVFKLTGDPKYVKYTAFLEITRPTRDGMVEYDMIDIYKVEGPVTPEPHYYGCSGVSFNANDYNDGTPLVLMGDSDPIGTVTLKFDTVKK